tara:strand:- start:371 stop:718 length:348 start_codon:yes stop_codon:yes gene_type:complete
MADPTYETIWGFQSATPLEAVNGGDDDGLVTTVHWNLTCTASDGFTGYYFDAMGLEKGDTVIPLKDLTKDQVIGWIKTKLGSDEVTKLEAQVKQECIDKRTPASISTAPTSWASS